MPDGPVIEPAAEILWAPFWREDTFDYHYLLPYEREVWDVVHASWRIDISETFGKELPFAFVGTESNPYLLFPSNVAYHTGIAPPDKLETETPGEEFMKSLTQIRIPILFLSKQIEMAILRWILSTASGPIPIPGIARDLFELANEKKLTVFYPTIYADGDTASKFLTILYWLQKWEDVIGHKVNLHTSKIVCFHADQAVKDTMKREIKRFGFAPIFPDEKLVWEFNPKKDYYKIREQYGFYPTEPYNEWEGS